MTPRRQRMLFVALIVLGVAAAVALALAAFRSNILYFYDPSAVYAGKVPTTKTVRLGGMVEQGSVQREPGSLKMSFAVTDFSHEVAVHYTGVLPDLFREGQGVIVRGRLLTGAQGYIFEAEEVLAKHDENYMPPEVAASLRQAHETRRAQETPSTQTQSTPPAVEK